MSAVLVAEDGRVLDQAAGWLAVATVDELDLLARLSGPVLDIGCGPGRLTVALASLGTPALGVDASPDAVRLAVRRGATALVRSVFETLPGEGRWGTVLLADGCIGIGGDPKALLKRATSLLRTGGQVVVEVLHPGRGGLRGSARIEAGGERGPWFPWATVGSDELEDLTWVCGLEEMSRSDVGGRCFAHLARRRERLERAG